MVQYSDTLGIIAELYDLNSDPFSDDHFHHIAVCQSGCFCFVFLSSRWVHCTQSWTRTYHGDGRQLVQTWTWPGFTSRQLRFLLLLLLVLIMVVSVPLRHLAGFQLCTKMQSFQQDALDFMRPCFVRKQRRLRRNFVFTNPFQCVNCCTAKC